MQLMAIYPCNNRRIIATTMTSRKRHESYEAEKYPNM